MFMQLTFKIYLVAFLPVSFGRTIIGPGNFTCGLFDLKLSICLGVFG